MARLRAGCFVMLLFGGPGSGFAAGPEQISDSAMQQIGALEQEKASRSGVSRKLDSQFVYQLKQNRGQAIAAGVTTLKPDIQFEPDGRVLVDIDANVTDALLAQIRQAGGTIISSFPRFHSIRAQVPMGQLENLGGQADVKFIRRASKALTNTGAVESEGDTTHRAGFARNNFGVNGQGVKVGVLSDSIDYLSYAQASGDLGDVTVLPGQAGSGSGEGTAMLEIVHDLAPGAQLYFATAFNGEASFAQNILNLRSNGCDIIVDDVYYFDEPAFQDGIIAQAVNAVTADGALYFSAAGNDGNFKDHTSGTWEGDFVDSGQILQGYGAKIHSFGATNYDIVLSVGAGVDLFWADPLGASTNDYDLFVLDSTGSYVVASSLNPQTGTQDPYENISYVAAGDRIVVVQSTGASRFLHLVTSGGLLSSSTGGATRGHSAAAQSFSVAATDALNSYPNPFSGGSVNPVETFSSDGPRRVFYNADGSAITPGNFSSTGGVARQKPDITAADGVATYTFGQFFGTSAAAPHAGAIAALMLSYNHTLTPTQIRAALTNSALDIEGPGMDANSGAGIVMAQQALQTLQATPVVIAGDAALVNESCPNGVIDSGETVTVALSLVNIGVTNTGNLIATLLNTGGVNFASGPQSYGALAAHGGTAIQFFTFIASGGCGGTNTVTLQLQDGALNLGTVSFVFQMGLQRISLSETFDEVTAPALPKNWAVGFVGGGVRWQTTSNLSDTFPNSIFAPEVSAPGESILYSRQFHVFTASAQLTFRQDITQYYSGYSGGVLEISTNGGASFTDIVTAGGSFVTNGYDTSLYTGYSNPLEGRQAWSSYSGGFVTTIVNLPASAAGQLVRLRWIFGTGLYSYGYGWYIDSVSLTDGFVCCTPATNNVVVGMTEAPNPVVLGGNLTYTINVENTGPGNATGVSLTDVLPASFTLQSISFSEGVYPGPVLNGGGSLNFNIGTLAGGATATITLSGAANQAGWLTNRVTIARGDGGLITSNSASAVAAVILPSLSINDVSLYPGTSGTTNAVFTVTLSPVPAQTATVNYATADLTATAGTDYYSANGTLTFAPGVSNQTLAVQVIGSLLNKADNQFAVNLSGPTNAVISQSQGIGTILNANPLPYLSVSDATVVEPDSGTTNAVFNVSLSPPSGQTVSVYFDTSDGTAIGYSDYIPVYTNLTFNPGQTNITVSVVVTNHATVKPSQIFNASLYSAYNAKITRANGLGTIITALPGHMDHFDWAAIPSPQSNGLPFSVSISSRDFFEGLATNFTGPAALSGSFVGSYRTNTMFDNSVAPDYGNDNAGTIGNAFTPNTNLLVTHVRSYFGTKVSIWTAAGVLLASQNVTSVPGTWVETPLATPVQLLAGHTYLVGVYTAGTFYGDFYQGSTFADGTINQAYYVYGDGFPDISSSYRWFYVDIRYTVGVPAPLPISPTNSGAFTNGLWSGNITVQLPATNVTLIASDNTGHAGQSLPFNVTPTHGQVTHFGWGPVASPQTLSNYFGASITAWDYFNNTASNFTGPVMLTASIGAARTNAMFGNIDYSSVYNYGTYTLGYSFTPNTNILVTYVRSYFGTKVSIWTDGGTLLASQNVNSTPGSWVETALSTPLQLFAGQTYRIGVYSAGNNYYGRFDMSPIFTDGVINQEYYTSGDGFPASYDSWQWILVDIRYTVATQTPVPVSPANSSAFTNGVWAGNLRINQLATNATLFASDGVGHSGQSLPFNVVPPPGQVTHFVWSPIASPKAVSNYFGATITARDYFNNTASNFTGPVAISASGPAIVTLTNTMFGNTNFGNTNYPNNFYANDETFGQSFTPTNNITVTHIRYYFGSKVSIWANDETLLSSNNVTSTPGAWAETALSSPLQLSAGQTYYIGVYVPPYTNASYPVYYRTDLSKNFPDGVINQAYYYYGDNFPIYSDTPQWYLVDIRYTVPALTNMAVAVSPANSSMFTNGVSANNLVINRFATNLTLLANDGIGHTGLSNPFNVGYVAGYLDHFVWSAISSPQTNAAPFTATITAFDHFNNVATHFNGAATLQTLTTPPAPSIAPASGNFYQGLWTGSISLMPATASTMVLRVNDGLNHTANSNPFNLVDPPLLPPLLQSAYVGSNSLQFGWSTVPGHLYQLQYKTNLLQTNWLNLGSPTNATSINLWLSQPIGPDPQRFFRVQLQ